MFVNFITNKWVLCAFGFLIMLSVTCVLWYQYDIAHYRKSIDTADTFLHQLETNKKTSEKEGVIEQSADDVSVKNTIPTADIPITEATTEVKNNVGTEQRQVSTTTENAAVAENLVSPFGFGPYPTVPDDYPLNPPIWLKYPTGVGMPSHALDNIELLDRVLVKLWKQGHKNITGASTAYGKIYPHYTDVVYVKYIDIPLGDGTVNRLFTRIKTGPDLAYIIPQIEAGSTPPGIKLVNFDDAGIDPHIFLKEEK